MKNILILSSIMTGLNITTEFLPSKYLLLSIFILIVIDFLTGVLKAVVKNEPRTSKKYRETFGKYIQYTGTIVLSIFISFMIYYIPEFKGLSTYAGMINNLILWGISLIELLSICENLIEIDNKSIISKFIISPLKNILSLEFKRFTDKVGKDTKEKL